MRAVYVLGINMKSVNQKIDREPNLKNVFDDMAMQVREAKESAEKKQKDLQESLLKTSIIEREKNTKAARS